MNEWPYPGARWWKFDFHTHTPASGDTLHWKKAIGTPDEVTPEKWLLHYMAAGIDCVAITDHNHGEWIDPLKKAYAAMKKQADKGNPPKGFRELYLFPGVEISVCDGIHVLAVFDTSKDTSTIISLLGAVGFPEKLYGHTDSNDEAACTRESLIKVVEEIGRRSGIVIPAHCDGDKGLLQVIDGKKARHTDAIKSLFVIRIDAIEIVDRESVKPSIYTASREQWTEIVGSDCHTLQGQGVPGSRYTWVKMANPTIDGLRLALLDGAGISIRRSDEGDFDPYKTPDHFIESITVENMRYMGKGNAAEFLFNPYCNAIVGGRGTGKSTLIHALRLVYRREKDLDQLKEDADARRTFESFNQVPENRGEEGGLENNTNITASVMREGVRYHLHWMKESPVTFVEEISEGKTKASVSQEILHKRFPIRIFSQGQIADFAGENKESLLFLLDEAAGADVCHRELSDAKQAYYSLRGRIRELEGKLKNRNLLNVQVEDVRRKLKTFEKTGHAEILKRYQITKRQENEVAHILEQLQALIVHIQSAAEECFLDDISGNVFAPKEDDGILTVISEISSMVNQTKIVIDKAGKKLSKDSLQLQRDKRFIQWQSLMKKAKSAYETLVKKLQEQGIDDPNEFGRLVQEQQRLEKELKQLEDFEKQKKSLEEKAETVLQDVWKAHRRISEVRREFLSKNLSKNPFVHMALIPYASDPRSIERSLRELINVTDVRFRDDILDIENGKPSKGIVADFYKSFDKKKEIEKSQTLKGKKRLDNTVEISVKDLQQQLINTCMGEGILSASFKKNLKTQAEKTPELFDRIRCWFPEDGLRVEYSRGGDSKDFQPIAQASAGQRAAAMLSFLLSYGQEPIILDQPEDDLDNHLIYNLIVRQIREQKLRRQLIIVTHNPNIVVNGDAELIFALEFGAGQCYIKDHGSLQESSMRDEICRIMEGGRDAFERRWKRLGREA